MKRRSRRPTQHSPRRPARWRWKPLLYLGLLVLAGGAIYVRARLEGPPSSLADLPLPELEARAGREPRNHWLQLELGVRFVKAGEPESAEAAFQRCLAIAPDTMEAYAYLGTMYVQRQDNARAAQMFERAVASNPDFANGHLELAALYEKLHNYRRARAAADRYVALRPDDWQGHYQRGLLCFLEGELESARESYTQAVRLAPERSAGYLAAGLACLFQSATPAHLSDAGQWFERGLKVDPRSASLHFYVGLTRFRQRQWEDAATALKQAVQLDPQLTEAYYPLGQTLRKLGRTEEARPYLERFAQMRVADRQRAAEQMRQGLTH
jgi:tetratricopeptide (TPR) repeat protein